MIVMIDKVGMLQMMCFMQEILRLGHKTSLYYPVYPSYTNEQVRYWFAGFLLLNIFLYMIPVPFFIKQVCKWLE